MKKIIIMGASSGIGLRVAEELAKRGVRVGLAARKTKSMHELRERYPAYVEYMSIDVTHRDAPEKLYNLIEKVGGMDIYFHVAGIGYENLDLYPEREDEIIRTNAGGFARMISAAYRWMRDEQVKGQIAAVTSVAGTNGIARLSAYSSSKKCAQTYLVAMEQLANAENSGISFTDIRPGWIRTPLLRQGVRYPMEMDLDYAVPLIIKAIARKKRVAYIDCRWGILASLWKLIPDALWTKVDIRVSKPDMQLPDTPASPSIPADPDGTPDIPTEHDQGSV